MSIVSRGFISMVVFFAGISLCTGQSELEGATSSGLKVIAATATDVLKASEGEKVVVFGLTADSERSESGTNRVNFKGSDFYLVTFKSDLEPFGQGEPVEIFDGKRIAVTGVISMYRDKPQIKLTDPDQVQVIPEGDEFPPEEPQEIAGDPPDPVAVVAEKPRAPELEPEPPRENPPVDWRKFFK